MTPGQEVEIYGLLDPVTGELRYIGKANNAAKRLKSHLRDMKRRKSPLYGWLGKLDQPPNIKILERTLDWKEAERRLIAEYRGKGERLLNLADGGDEPFCPKEIRAANGQKAAIERNKTVHRLICYFGAEARRNEQRGNTGQRDKMRAAQRRLQLMTREQQDRFAILWSQRRAA